MKLSKQELEAIQSVAAAAEHVVVPLNKLVTDTEFQQRKVPHTLEYLKQLAATIKATGNILHNLVVVKLPKGKYAVAAGGGRTAAMRLMADAGEWPHDFPVRCLVVPAELAKHASLIENDFRAAMHPADRFDAYRSLAEQGKSADEIAVAHCASVAHVRQLLALGQVAPALLQLFRESKLKLEHMQAFTLTTDHQRQLDAWDAAKNSATYQWTSVIRSALVEEALSGRSAIARYVTVSTYQKAGGQVISDLFADGPDSVTFKDVPLLHKLAIDKLGNSKLFKAVQGEGWKWVEVQLELTSQDKGRFGTLQSIPRPLTSDEKAARDVLVAAKLAADAAWEALNESDDEVPSDDWSKAGDACNAADEALEDFDDAVELVYDPAHQTLAGCIVHLDYDGKVTVTRGLIRQEDRAHFVALQADADGGDDSNMAGVNLPQVKTRPVHSEALVQRLHAQRTAAVQVELMQRPNLTLCLFVAQLATRGLDGHVDDEHRVQCLFDVSSTGSRFDLAQVDPSIKEAPAWKQMDDALAKWKGKLPQSHEELVDWLLQQPQEDVIELQAVLLSLTVYRSSRNYFHGTAHVERVAQRIDLDMTDWWKPTAESYFKHVSKDQIANAVVEAGAGDAAPYLKMKKGEAAAAAETAMVGKCWLPEPIHTPPVPAASSDRDSKQG